MSRLTLFSAPKPFTDPQIERIQKNALASWSRLPDVEILLMGDEDGMAEAAAQAGARLLTGVAKNWQGTPLVSSMMRLARQYATSELLCIINSDVIVMRDLVEAAAAVKARARRFLLLGRRWDISVRDLLEFRSGWEDRLRDTVRLSGELHRPAGSDFFVFPRDCYAEVPNFAVGRAGWDNWMIYRARQQGWPVVDCTQSVMAVHQDHDYRHLPGGAPHYSMPESAENIRLAGGHAPIRYTVLDATHNLRAGRLVRPPLSYARLIRGLELLLRAMFFFLPSWMVEELARPKRWKKRLARLFGKHGGQSG